MGRNDGGRDRRKKQEELLSTLGDFTSKDNWDQFFTIRGSDDSFEWYAEWPQLRNLLTTSLLSFSSLRLESTERPETSEQVNILVPGCGNSRLSEHLYDSGFKNITNVDFSKVVISDMLRRNVRERPGMKWRVMDMTDMHYPNDAFDAIVDKGGLDALMEPELGPSIGMKYLSEVKRLLKVGGRYICLTLAESHVLGILFPKFRFGWEISLYAVSQDPSSGGVNLHTFMFVAVKVASTSVFEISLHLDNLSAKYPGNQVSQLREALKIEDQIREEQCDIFYYLEDLNIGVKGNLGEIEPGRRFKLVLGEHGVSRSLYTGVLLDASRDLAPFSYIFAIFLVPKMRAHEWLFSSEEGQWVIVESSKSARLVMILLDSSNSDASMEDIQKDLSPLVKQLAPSDCNDGVQIPFMAASDGIKQREIVHEVISSLTGPIVVDEVVYQNVDDDLSCHFPSKDLIFRRLTFQRSENLVQSEAFLSVEEPIGISEEVDKTKVPSASKNRKKGRQKVDSRKSTVDELSNMKKIDHTYLASSYHNGIIAGVMLFSAVLKRSSTDWSMTRTVIIGLGAGLLPMFMRNFLPYLDIEVIELDPEVLAIAKEYFGFIEDGNLRTLITDGLKFVKDEAEQSKTEGSSLRKISVLIIDVDSSDMSSGLSCPAAEFVDESFLLNARDSLCDHGCLIINLVSRSSAVKKAVCSSLKTVFGKSSSLFKLQLEEDVNEIIFAVKTNGIDAKRLAEAHKVLPVYLKDEKLKWCQRIIRSSNMITPLI